MLEDVIFYCLVSSVLPRIIVKLEEPLFLRSQVNILINAPFGAGKTEILEKIERKGLGRRIMNWTKVGFLGTIKRNGEIVPPQTVLCAGKTVLIDEFQAVPVELKLPLLSLMEEQRADRVLSFEVPQPINYVSSDGYWSVTAEHGCMTTKVRASYLVVTSKLNKTHTDRMLQSRCIQINIQTTYEDLKHGIASIKLDSIQEIRNEIKDYKGLFTEEEYKEVLNTVIDELKRKEIPPNYGYRVTAELIRIMNIKDALGEDRDEAYKLLDFILHGIQGSYYTPLEFKVYSLLREKERTAREISKILEISETTTKAVLNKLMSKSIVKKSGKKYSIIW